ncbi:MAG: hypothetical protein Q4G66_03240 [bacterium]|nr:hypothetical protein [bacterium]
MTTPLYSKQSAWPRALWLKNTGNRGRKKEEKGGAVLLNCLYFQMKNKSDCDGDAAWGGVSQPDECGKKDLNTNRSKQGLGMNLQHVSF